MDSSELYFVKQQFLLGAFKALISTPLPVSTSPDYTPILLYQARAHVALNDPKSALALISSHYDAGENVSLKAVMALARYVDTKEEEALEALRDICVEVEGEDALDDREKDLVRVLAATAFARAGEVEEALETLSGASESLEATASTVHIYLSISRPDLATKAFNNAKKWAEDDLLLQLIESTIGLATGKDAYADAFSFYTEQLGNPSVSSPHLLASRGIVRILKGEVAEARSDFEEVLEQSKNAGGKIGAEEDALAGYVVATGLGAGKDNEAEDLWTRLIQEYPSHPLVVDVAQKASLFDELAMRFDVPPLAVPTSA